MANKKKPKGSSGRKNGGRRAPTDPPPPPYIAIIITDPQEHQFVGNLAYNAQGTTSCLYGAVVQYMTRQVIRTSIPQLIGDVTDLGPPYDPWSTPITAGDCPTPGDYELLITAKDATSGCNFVATRDFQAP